ncbi:50S ribosomal protein L16 [Phyllosticta citricarpa]|uniref:50S ribosomal protein L16 n=2 Tax=Phyllosticta TaxID=121621 RepID=A0ABR1MLS6_9PEZI
MPPPRLLPSLGAPLRRSLFAGSQTSCLQHLRCTPQLSAPASRILPAALASKRPFSTTSPQQNWLFPKAGHNKKDRKGRPRVRTGGSTIGTTVAWGDYGLRMIDTQRRIPAKNLRIAEETIRKRLRGMKFRLYMRVTANIGVYMSGNEQRMGKGKGSFKFWATRVAVNHLIFELKGDVHEQVVKDAFRMAGNKLPGQYEFVRKGDPAVMGITKLGNGVTKEDLMRPRKKLPLEQTADRLPASPPP